MKMEAEWSANFLANKYSEIANSENTVYVSMVDYIQDDTSVSADFSKNEVNESVEDVLSETYDSSDTSESSSDSSSSDHYSFEKIKFSKLLKVKEMSKRDILQWFMDVGLISSTYVCPKCERPMKCTPKDISDGYVWRCRGFSSVNLHSVARSVRKGTVFSESRLSLIEILMYFHCWVYKVPHQWIFLEMNSSLRTLIDWWDLCRIICVEICARDDSKIGGFDKVIEIIGGKFETQKYRKVGIKESWVFAGVEDKHAEKSFIRLVEKCDKNSFLEVIKNSVLPGTTIISEFCDMYSCMEDEDFVNLSQNYSYKFNNYDSSDHHVNFWSTIKRQMSHHNSKEGYFDKHLGEFIWRQRISGAYDKMVKFIQGIKTVFPPPNKD